MSNVLGGHLMIKYLTVASLKPYRRNPRTHPPRQIKQIASSIQQFGFTLPILIDAKRCVIAGHARLEAAKLLGLGSVPTIRLDYLSEPQKRAYLIADNKLAENAGWDRELLALELHYLSELDLDFDLTITGFEAAEIDLLFQSSDLDAADDAADEIPEIDASKACLSRYGDLWNLGRHRLLCADATKPDSYEHLLGGRKAQIVFTDPPYNTPIDGHVCGLGSIRHREFPMAAGEMPEAEFISFLSMMFGHLARHSHAGSIHFVCMDWRHMWEIMSAGREVNSEVKNLCVWTKDNGGMGSLYRSRHELVFVFKNGTAAHINNIELGRFGRNRTNVWSYPGVNSFRKGRLDDLAMHPTVKPVAMVADAILDCSRRGAIVLDCFGGSGTTLIAADRTGRHGYLMELDPVYVDVTIERFQKMTGKKAVHASTGLTFEEVRHHRTAQNRESAATTAGEEEE